MCAGICSINLMDTCAQGNGTEKRKCMQSTLTTFDLAG